MAKALTQAPQELFPREPVRELLAAVFLNPGPAGLLHIWEYAGPSCCCKASVLALGAGPVANAGRGGLLGEPSALPWREWWPGLAQCSLMEQLRCSSVEKDLSLDIAWVAIRARPELVNTTTPEGKPLLAFVLQGRRDVAELLRRSGALLSRRVADELLYEAAARGDVGLVDLLLFDSHGIVRQEPWAFVNAQPKRHGGTALDAAVGRGQTACVELLRRTGGRHSLHWSARHALPADLAAWLADGACADERDSSGATPLWLAVRGTKLLLRVPVELFKCEVKSEGGSETPRDHCVRLLLEARAAVDVLPITMETPLLVAAASGDLRRCSQLLEACADPMVCDRDGRTVLSRAANNSVHELLLAAVATQQPCPAWPVSQQPQEQQQQNFQEFSFSAAQQAHFPGRAASDWPWPVVDATVGRLPTIVP